MIRVINFLVLALKHSASSVSIKDVIDTRGEDAADDASETVPPVSRLPRREVGADVAIITPIVMCDSEPSGSYTYPHSHPHPVRRYRRHQ